MQELESIEIDGDTAKSIKLQVKGVIKNCSVIKKLCYLLVQLNRQGYFCPLE